MKRILFSDIDKTLVHPPDAVVDSLRVEQLGFGVPSMIAQLVVLALRTLHESSVRLCLVTGRRFSGCSPFKDIIPVDHIIFEHGGVILGRDGLPDPEWSAIQQPITGVYEKHDGPLWDWERQLRSEGYEVDSDGRWASFRVRAKSNNLSAQQIREMCQRDLPPGITSTVNLGDLDFIPQTSGKLRAAQFIAQRYQTELDKVAAMGDDINDTDLLESVCFPLTLQGALPEIVDLVRARRGYIAPQPSHRGTLQMLDAVWRWAR